MYDEIVKTIDLSSDETDLLLEILENIKDTCASLGEEITIQTLIEKLK